MSGIKVLSLAPIAAAMELPNIASGGWEKIGIVGLLILAVVAIWRDSGKRQDKLEKIIERNTEAMTHNADTLRATSEVVVEVKSAIERCRK